MELNLETAELQALLPNDKVTDEYVAFFSNKSLFSNTFSCNFAYNGESVHSAEQALLYGKAMLLGDYEMTSKVINSDSSPMSYQRLNKQIKGDLSLWNKYRSRVMISILDDKFNNSERLYLLKATGSRKLLLASPYDSIWGIGAGTSNVDMVWNNYSGKNLLGDALMKVRNINSKSWPVFTAQTQEADIAETHASFARLLPY